MIISETTFEKTRKKVQDSPKNETIIFTSKDDDLNRKVLEKLPINILLGFYKNLKSISI